MSHGNCGAGDAVAPDPPETASVAVPAVTPAAETVNVTDGGAVDPSYATLHAPVAAPAEGADGMVKPDVGLLVSVGVANAVPLEVTTPPGAMIVSPAASSAVHVAVTVAAVPLVTPVGESVSASDFATPSSVNVMASPLPVTVIGKLITCESASPEPSLLANVFTVTSDRPTGATRLAVQTYPAVAEPVQPAALGPNGTTVALAPLMENDTEPVSGDTYFGARIDCTELFAGIRMRNVA